MTDFRVSKDREQITVRAISDDKSLQYGAGTVTLTKSQLSSIRRFAMSTLSGNGNVLILRSEYTGNQGFDNAS